MLSENQRITTANEHFHSNAHWSSIKHPSWMQSCGIYETTFNSIMKCDVHIFKDLYTTLMLSSSTTMYPDIHVKMKKENTAWMASSMNIKTFASPKYEYSVWICGSYLASLPNFQ
ncbi:actin, muscle-like [Heterocephalus glaber]|uniref:Actin, muscle-like n=1 Tax=Heterocephalus glaber TaxID=10181 RepID=A0AAX6R5X2_HETGA|nr:actin, muscle-like [Heterocephalus glaber]